MNPPVSVIIPTLNAEREVEKLIKNLQEVQTLKPCEIIVVDSSSEDRTAEVARDLGCRVFVIKREEFNHGKTRTFAGKQAKGEILVYFTQDALPYDEKALENLIKPLIKHTDVACAYGRQIPYPDADICAKFLRYFNYPEKSFFKSYKDRKRFGRKTVFFSNSFSAYKKSVLEEIGWFKGDLISYEDIYAVSKILKKGYKLAYVAEAKVWHSHPWKPWQDFKRHFELGIFFRCENWILKEFGKRPKDENFFIMLKEFLKIADKENRRGEVVKFLTMYVLRKGAFFLGYNYKFLPKRLSKKLLTNKR